MRILGIETSCDETATAIVEDGTKILSNIVASSQELHKKTGGIIPEVAAREQIRCILPVIDAAVQSAKCKVQSLDAIAVTVGPGLIGSLLVGVETAKTLAWVWKKPIVPVNHLVAHIYANFIGETPQFPAIALVVSGGHTDLVLIKNHGKIKWLGGTRDDAAGECFDKCARVLGLGYPGGPAIAAEAAKLGNRNQELGISLPRPMIKEENFDFSFSGLKTAVIREVKKIYPHNSSQTHNPQPIPTSLFAHEIQEAITDVLVEKTIRAAEKFKVKSILLAGGVAANKRLKEKLSNHLIIQSSNYQLFIPEPKLCTDNAAYISSFAYFNFKPIPWQKISVNPGLGIDEKAFDKI